MATDISHEDAPARPQNLSVEFFTFDNEAGFIDRGRGRRGPAGFLLLWLAGWTVGCVFIAREALTKGEWQLYLFGIPFWGSWLFVVGLVLYMLFGRTDFALTAKGAFVIRKVLVQIQERFVPLDEVQRFEPYAQVSQGKSRKVEYGVELRTLGKPIRLAGGVPADERDWLCRELNHRLELLRGPDYVPRAVDSAGPPSDCSWTMTNDFTLDFQQRGKFSFAGLMGALFICSFWNGIVSVFLYQLLVKGDPPGFEWYVFFLFLIPFEAIGALFVGLVVMVLMEPFRRSTWRFTDDAIEYHWECLGLHRSWTYPVTRLAKAEARRTKWKAPKTDAATLGQEQPYSVRFVDPKNVEIAAIKNLTEGEARWIGQMVRVERETWFR